MKKITLIFLVLLVCALPAAAQQAEDHIGKFGLGINMSIQPLDTETDFYPGFHIRLRFNDTIGIQGEVSIRSSETEFTVADISSQPMSVSLMYFLLPKSMISLYLMGGVTFTKPSVEYTNIPGPSEEEGEWEKGFFGGLGVELPVNPSFVIHGEIRYIDLGFTITGFEVDYSGLNYSVGLTYYL